MFVGPGMGKLVRIATFIDGGYFDEVSKYYKFQHPRASRLNVGGVMEFIQEEVAAWENVDANFCQIVESHYFRGRFSTAKASEAGKLEDERRFDEVLMRAGVIQHYQPVDDRGFRATEKGIDMWLALEAFDLAVHKGFDVIVLIACDGDYVPLVKKLNGLGTRVMLLAWDFSYEYDFRGETRYKETRTSSELIRTATYPVMMNDIIDDETRQDDDLVNGLFVYG